MAASVGYTRQFDGVGAGSVYPRFFMDSVQDEIATAREGRPIFREIERVEIIMPGNQFLRPVHNVNDEHRMRWEREYKAFRQGIEIAPEGTPLEEWPALNKAQVLELKAMGMLTVEHVAQMTDTIVQQFRIGGQRIRERARAFLDDAAAGALADQMTHENEQLRSEIHSLRTQLEQLKIQSEKIFSEWQSARNAPSPLLTTIPGASDPMEQARQAGAPLETGGSAFDNFQPRRRGRPPRNREADAA